MSALDTIVAALLAPLAAGAVLYLVVDLWALWPDREDDEDDGPKWGRDR